MVRTGRVARPTTASLRLFLQGTMAALGSTAAPEVLRSVRRTAARLRSSSCLLIGPACLRRARVLIVSHRSWHALSWEDCLLEERQDRINKESQEPTVALRTSSLQRRRASARQLQATVKYYKWRQNTHLSSGTSISGFPSQVLTPAKPERAAIEGQITAHKNKDSLLHKPPFVHVHIKNDYSSWFIWGAYSSMY